jgi:hypothetical protein
LVGSGLQPQPKGGGLCQQGCCVFAPLSWPLLEVRGLWGWQEGGVAVLASKASVCTIVCGPVQAALISSIFKKGSSWGQLAKLQLISCPALCVLWCGCPALCVLWCGVLLLSSTGHVWCA